MQVIQHLSPTVGKHIQILNRCIPNLNQCCLEQTRHSIFLNEVMPLKLDQLIIIIIAVYAVLCTPPALDRYHYSRIET